MNTAIQTLEPPLHQTQVGGGVVADILPFQLTPEYQLRRAKVRVAQLQSEVNELRRALAQARRLHVHQEMLLRNARLREFELRSNLIERRQTDEAQFNK